MKLIGAGLPRTATMSQKFALEMLGLDPCYHMMNLWADFDVLPKWRRALDDPSVLTEILDGYDAIVDWPGAYFHAELLELYPDAKVLLSVRDPDAWAQSMDDTIKGLFYNDVLMAHMSAARCTVDPQWRGFIELMEEMWFSSGLMRGPDTTNEWMSQAMTRYHAQVARTVPSDRLLVWSPGDGWEPLCSFLELPVPEAPFPRINDSQQFVDGIIQNALDAVSSHRAREGTAVAAS